MRCFRIARSSFVEIHAFLRMSRNLHNLHPARSNAPQNPEVSRALDGDCIAGPRDRFQAERHGLERAAGDHHIVRADAGRQIRNTACDLPPQLLQARRKIIARTMRGIPMHDAPQIQVQPPNGKKLRTRAACAKAHVCRIVRRAEHIGENVIHAELPLARDARFELWLGDLR